MTGGLAKKIIPAFVWLGPDKMKDLSRRLPTIICCWISLLVKSGKGKNNQQDCSKTKQEKKEKESRIQRMECAYWQPNLEG